MTGRARLAAVLAAVLLVGGLGGCSATPSKILVIGPWVGQEERDFRDVLTASGIPYDYLGSRNVGELLRSAVLSNNPPDLAVLSSPGDLGEYVAKGKALPLDGILSGERDDYAASWLLSAGKGVERGQVYGIPVKAALKSMVWHDRAVTPPGDLVGLLAGPWCMGLNDPPNSGWPASDWVEDLLLHQRDGAKRYDEWVAGTLDWRSAAMIEAWQAWGKVVQDHTPGGAAQALRTRYGDAGRGMETKKCTLDHQPSFIRGSPAYGGDRYDFTLLPGVDARPRAEAAVDVAALFTVRPDAADMMAFLAGPKAQAIWPGKAGSGAFSVRHDAPSPAGTDVDRRIGEILAGRTAVTFCLDASDLMPAPLRNAFYRGLKEYLAGPTRLKQILARLQQIAEDDRPAVVFPACS